MDERIRHPRIVADQVGADEYFYQAEHPGELSASVAGMSPEQLALLVRKTERTLGRMGYRGAKAAEVVQLPEANQVASPAEMPDLQNAA